MNRSFTIFPAAVIALNLMVPLSFGQDIEDENCTQTCGFERSVPIIAQLYDDIVGMAAADRFAREQIIDLLSQEGMTVSETEHAADRAGAVVEQIDRQNADRLIRILETHSWQRIAEIDPHLCRNAWLIAQHATHDPEFQQETLRAIEPLFEQGLIEGQQYALLWDRVSLQQNGYQHFGTQYHCIAGIRVLHPVEDENFLGELRQSIGIGLVEEQMLIANELYGDCPE